MPPSILFCGVCQLNDNNESFIFTIAKWIGIYVKYIAKIFVDTSELVAGCLLELLHLDL